jgi:hypothetical protein
MLDPRLGGLRPWEMERLTPDEENRVLRYRDELNRQAEGV